MKKLSFWFLTGIFFSIILLKFLFVPLFDSIPPINETTKTCLVTGASSGIGLEIAREMINKDWKVIGLAHREKKLKNVAAFLGPNFIPYLEFLGPQGIAQVKQLAISVFNHLGCNIGMIISDLLLFFRGQ